MELFNLNENSKKKLSGACNEVMIPPKMETVTITFMQ